MLRDHGISFDPTHAPNPDLTLDLEDRPIGGLGVFLIKTLMDEIHYEALGESGNLLTMVKCRRKSK
jgi:anti-sigma regulatory factor (Ser/Thr protein kinase)